MRRNIAAGAICLALSVGGVAATASAATVTTTTDTAALAKAETAYAKVLSAYKPGAAWLKEYRAALSLVVTEQNRVTNDLYPPAKPKPNPVTTTTTPKATTTTTVPVAQPTVVSSATATGQNADASVDPLQYYSGPEELVVQVSPPQTGELSWDITCDEPTGGTADSGFQYEDVQFPTTQQLTLPVENFSDGCSIVADAQLDEGGTVTLQWVVTGQEVSGF